MRLPEDVNRCVVFLGWQKAGPVEEAPIDPKGTGFLVVAGPPLSGIFLVTARHVAEKLHAPFVVRFNHKDGKARLLEFERPEDARWCFHDDPTVDIAVMPIKIPSSFDGSALSVDSLLDPERAPKIWDEMGAGDPICVIGLFHFHHGQQVNLPMVHSGTIGMLPGDELIPINGKLVEGYLVQTNAISGCSGSPVFVASWTGINFGKTILWLPDHAVLMGVWSSSWKVEKSQIMFVRTDDDDTVGTAAPLGVGVVVPAKKLADILRGDKLQSAFDDLKKSK
jgi:hypothetical protein